MSSSAIRAALAQGEVERAARLLGRFYSLRGEVVKGAGRGRTLGIPTANLEVSPERAIPASGVYVCRAQAGPQTWGAVANIGRRPTFEDQEPALTVEAHLLDFDGDLYGRTLALEFAARLRPETRFPGPEALVAQIRADIEQARQWLEEDGASPRSGDAPEPSRTRAQR